MTYDDIVASFLIPPSQPILAPEVPSTPARRLRDALEPIATQGWWSRAAAERVVALGLGFFDGYVWGRAAALGTPSSSVVVATFGVFEPAMLTAVYELGRSVASRDDVLAARAEGAAESLAGLVPSEIAAAVADPLLEVVGALDGIGRPLFSGLRELPLPNSPHGRLWRAAELVREHRGDGHLAASVAAGLDAVTMNVFTELWLGFELGEYSGTRGFGPDRLATAMADLETRGWVSAGALTAQGRTARVEIELVTDASQHALVDALGARLDEIVAASEAISAAVLVARAFPHDPRKRAAG